MTAEELAAHFKKLHLDRYEIQERGRRTNVPRQILSADERNAILRKTDSRCHICGGFIDGKPWHADHVLSHSSGGAHHIDNYLPAHSLCNNYRWDYTPEEFQYILKLGVWLRTQIERRTSVGKIAALAFIAYESARVRRRKRSPIIEEAEQDAAANP